MADFFFGKLKKIIDKTAKLNKSDKLRKTLQQYKIGSFVLLYIKSYHIITITELFWRIT